MNSAKRILKKLKHQRDDPGPSSIPSKKFKDDDEQDEPEECTTGGLKSSLHGTIYQLKLLTLFLWRGMQNGYCFNLLTEMVEAEKFDDLVFAYSKNEADQKQYRFLQAKHKQNEEGKISKTDLLAKPDGNFSLQKYFISYRKIKQNKKFKEAILRDFIICTNIDLDETLRNNFFEEVKDKDDILNFNKGILMQLKKSTSFKKDLKSKLRETSECFRLAKKLAFCIHTNKSLELRDDLFKNYHRALGETILEQKTGEEGKIFGMFRSNFLNSSNSTPEYSFLKAFYKAYFDEINKIITVDEFCAEMKTKKFKLSSNFGIKSSLNDLSSFKSLPNDYTEDVNTNDDMDKEIENFLAKLVFAVKQPNEVELGKIIELEMRNTTKINFRLIDCELMASKLQEYMLNWMKEKKGCQLTHKNGKEFFGKVQEKINKLVMIGPTMEYCEKIEAFGIEFQGNTAIKLNKFLDSKDKQIFNFYCHYKNITLSSIKVYKTLKNKDTYKADDGYIFVRLSSLLRKMMLSCVLRAFESERTDNLLIIECETKENSQILYNKLKPIIKKFVNKKIILIGEANHTLVKKFKTHFLKIGVYEEKQDEENTWNNLTEESQNKVLKEGKVIFHGEEMFLSRLIDKKSNVVLEKVNRGLLTKIINKENIKIGEPDEDRKYEQVKDYYIERIFYRQEKIVEDIIKDPFIFVINNINEVPLSTIHSDIVVVSNEETDFEYICEKYTGKQIHWLEKNENGFLWKKSNTNDLSILRNFVEQSGQSIKKYEPRNITDITEKVVIIAAEPGMGKSTTLSHLAINTRSTLPAVWIVRSNSADYPYFEVWRNNGTKNRVMEAVIFLYEIVNFQLFKNFDKFNERKKKHNILEKLLIMEHNQIQFNLLVKYNNGKVLLKNNKIEEFPGSSKLMVEGSAMLEIELFTYFYNQGLIVLLFDGFDEISPTYKNEVIQLLQSLQQTKIKSMWITTRCYNDIQNEIENELGTFSYSFEPLKKEEQKMFLKKFWEKNLEGDTLNEHSLNICIKKLLKKFSSITNDQERKFISIPLQLYMIANIFKEIFKSINDNSEKCDIAEIDEVFYSKCDLVCLYQLFLEKKFKTATERNYLGVTYYNSMRKCINKIYLDSNYDDDDDDDDNDDDDDSDDENNDLQEMKLVLMKSHEILAVDLLLPGIYSKSKQIQKLKSMVKKGQEKAGIIIKIINDKPEFIHLTFAEYLAANLLWKIFKSIKIEKFNNFIQRFIIENIVENEEVQLSKFFALIVIKSLEDQVNNSQVMIQKFSNLLMKLVVEMKKHCFKPEILPYNKFQINYWEGKQREPIELLIQIFEYSSLLESNNGLIHDNINDCEDQYSLLCLCANGGYNKIVNAIAKEIKPETLKKCVQQHKWLQTPLGLVGEMCNLEHTEELVNKYSEGIQSWKDVEGKLLIEQIMIGNPKSIEETPTRYENLLPFLNRFSDKPYQHGNTLKLPIIEILRYKVSYSTIQSFAKQTDFDVVNEFIHSVATNNVLFDCLYQFIHEYNEKTAEFIVKKGIDFSKIINLLLLEYTYSSLYILTKNYIDYGPYYYSDGILYRHNLRLRPITDEVYCETSFLNISQKITHLLKCGTGYNYKSVKYKLTTFQVMKQIKNIYSILESVRIIYKNDETYNPQDIILGLIVESIAKHSNFKGYNIIIRSGQISLLPNFNNASHSSIALYNQEIRLIPQLMLPLFSKYYTDRYIEIKSYLNENKRFIDYAKKIPDIESWIVYDYEQKLGKNLDNAQSHLLDAIIDLYELQQYTIDDAGKEVEKRVLRIQEVMNKLLEKNKKLEDGEQMHSMEEILQIFDIKNKYTEKLLIFTSDGIHLLIEIWPILNYIGQRKIMEIFEKLIKLLEPSIKLCEQFEKLDNLYEALIDVIKTENYIQMDEILQDNPEVIKAVINGQDDELGSPLHYASYKGDLKTTERLLKYGANPILRLNQNAKLLLPPINSKEQMVEKNDKYWNYENWSSLHLAALNNNEQVVQKLIEYGAKVDAPIYAETAHKGETALHISALLNSCNIKVALFLLENGAQYDIRNIKDETPLNLAKPGSDIGKLLHYIDELFKAVKFGKNNLFHSLLEEKDSGKIRAILKARNTDNKTLIQATEANDQLNISRLLKEKLKSIELNYD